MKLCIRIAAIAIAACLADPALAAKKARASQDVDFSKITCKQFLQEVANSSAEEAGMIMIWLDGYLSGVTGDAVMRADGMEAFGVNLGEHCARRGNDRLLDAARQVGIQ